MRPSRKRRILKSIRLVVAGYLLGRFSPDHAVAAVNKLELFVIRANIARFARLLGMETEEQTRIRLSALLDQEQQKLKTSIADSVARVVGSHRQEAR